ncbi:MAG TPA: hypothetical protein VGM56_21165, partial [Byssovorax sp.]
MKRRALVAVCAITVATAARAEPSPIAARDVGAAGIDPAPDTLTFRADVLEVDGERVALKGGVVVGVGRYRLRSDALEVSRDAGSVTVVGAAHLAPCRCADPPVTLGVSSARVDADGDVSLWFPRVEIARVPVFALPWIELRAPGKPGLLPPIVELRGADGALLGGGARLPLGAGSGTAELSLAGFTAGGVELWASVETPRTSTRLLFDERAGERAVAVARGAIGREDDAGPALTWDVDALRGGRAVAMTPDLLDATRPSDTAAEEAALASGGAASSLVSAGVVARGLRGDGELLAGPRVGAGLGAPLGRSATIDGRVDVAVLAASMPGACAAPTVAGCAASLTPADMAIADGVLGATIDPRVAPLEAHVEARARARAASEADDASAREVAASAVTSLGLPFVRRFAAAEGSAPLAHLVDPVVEAGVAIGDRASSAGALSTLAAP